MRISEIFRSIQGESSFAGLPCTFVRTAGCSLRCAYCDTGYALDKRSGEEMSLTAVLERACALGVDLVEITGGEPLEQPETPELCQRLLDLGAVVLAETSGAFPVNVLPAGVIKIMDIKTPSSRMAHRNHWANLAVLSPRDEVKFVIADREDFEWSVAVCQEQGLFHHHSVLFSPSFAVLPPVQLAQWILLEKIPVRLNLQIHKFIWEPGERGV
ncbi:MAG TPA: radical SAM protein [bacterium]|nr:radical SAM protein [Candidatus Omnitrophota bacterium]HOJ60194.1 radical SAM protein [bacterium]HOL96328.1 radical SAM protein [bacterium]